MAAEACVAVLDEGLASLDCAFALVEATAGSDLLLLGGFKSASSSTGGSCELLAGASGCVSASRFVPGDFPAASWAFALWELGLLGKIAGGAEPSTLALESTLALDGGGGSFAVP